MRFGSGRVGSGSLTGAVRFGSGRVGSGQVVLKSHGLGQVGGDHPAPRPDPRRMIPPVKSRAICDRVD